MINPDRNPESTAPESMVRQVIERWRGGARPDAASFLTANPEVRERKSLAMDLIYEEYCLRNESGETLVPSTFCQKFPTYRQSLQRLIDVHQFLDAHPEEAEEKKWTWPEPGDSVLGFKILQKLGEGAIAKVYLAQQPDLGQRRVVVKVSRNGATEAKLLGKLEHPSIVPIHSVHQDASNGLTCICMPFLGTATLVDLLDLAYSKGQPPATAKILLTVARQYQPVGIREADEPEAAPILEHGTYVEGILQLGVQLAEALAAAHDAGVMHRDIKPSNVLLSRSGRPMLLDFNLSTDLDMPLERVGGTVAYMAPERIRCLIADNVKSESKIDPRSDVYSLGALLYELLCGELPSRPQTAPGKQARMEEWLKGRLTPPPGPSTLNRQVSREMDRVLLKALSPDPVDRFSSAAEFAKALRATLTWKARTVRWLDRHRRRLLAGGAALLAALTISAVIWASSESRETLLFNRGQGAYSEGDSKSAIDCFDSVLQLKPDDIAALFARGQAHRQAKNFELALKDYQAAYDKCGNPELLAYVGLCEMKARNFDPARGNFETAIKEGVSSPLLVHNIAYCLSRTGEPKEAAQRLEMLLAREPDLFLSHHLCARLQLDQTRNANIAVDDALRAHIQEALRGIPGEPLLALDAARVYAYSYKITKSQVDEAQALAFLRQAVETGATKTAIVAERDLSPRFFDQLSPEELRRLEKAPKMPSTPLHYEPSTALSIPAMPAKLAGRTPAL
jgi:serine/threonine protein kinase